MPGLFEEFLLACRSQVPTYIVGTFGGIGGYLAKALLGGEIDERFTLDDQLGKQKNKEKKLPELINEYHKHKSEGVVQPETFYEELRDILKKGKSDGSVALNVQTAGCRVRMWRGRSTSCGFSS